MFLRESRPRIVSSWFEDDSRMNMFAFTRQSLGLIRRLLLLGAVCLASMSYGVAQPSGSVSATPPTFLLYSWQDSKGVWNFSLFSGFISRELLKREVLNHKIALTGVEKLKLKMLQLQPGSTLIWYDSVLNHGQFESLGYPPDDVIQEIRGFARDHRIEVVEPWPRRKEQQ